MCKRFVKGSACEGYRGGIRRRQGRPLDHNAGLTLVKEREWERPGQEEPRTIAQFLEGFSWAKGESSNQSR